MAVLDPGVTKRRWEPEEGTRKLNERIHRESRAVDNHSNLSFTFSKPSKPKRHNVVECKDCGHMASVPINTVGMICTECKKYVCVGEV